MKPAPLLPILVCERTGRWSAALRSLPLPPTVRLFEFGTLEHVAQQLDATGASIVCLEITAANALAIYRWLWTVGEEYPHARYIVFNEPAWTAVWDPRRHDISDHDAMEDLLREAGAIQSIASTRDVDRLLPIVGRYLSSGSFVTLNGREQTAIERVLAVLPWSD